MNYLNWDMQFMLGLAAVASVRVSNELGAGHAKVAKFSVFVVNGTSILISIIFTAIILIFRVALSKLFTSHDEVITAISNLTPLLAISVFLNGIQPILSGLNNNLGKKSAFWCTLDQYWALMDCMHEDGRFGHMCVQVCV
ncbi:hypothetical protein PS2_024180 [Malus domestica]